MAFKNVFFDLDGTLTNPYRGITNSILYALDLLGVKAPSDLSWCIGPPLQDSFSQILEGTDVGVDKAVNLYREYFSEKGLYENSVYEGIQECLSAIATEGKELYVATSKPHVYAKRIIDHFALSEFFVEIHGSELDGTRTDKASLIGYILETDDLDPFNCVMIGDRKHDLIGASKNSVDSVGVLWGYGDISELEAERPTTIAYNPKDLASWICRH